jgi:hypothetical protein
MRRTTLVVIGAVFGVAAGCGGSSSSPPSQPVGGSSAGSTAASAGPTAAEKAADLKQSAAMVPRLSDFPTGWARDLGTNTSNDKKCKISKAGLVKTSEVGKDHAVSFRKGDTTEVASVAATWETEEQTQTAYQRTVDGSIARCFARVFEQGAKRGAGDGATVGTAQLSQVSFPTIGDESTVYRVDLPIEASGLTFHYYVDYAVFRVGRGIGALIALNLNEPFDQRFLVKLTKTLAARGAAAARDG